ncbi:MAG TPA: MBL fold metallo-hydrolase [Burkholderiales bacterium]|nr:MBL fold metallo-hydrolase [Burkholderiales bacterium]
MKVRFWGTRGSIPAALTAKGVREKLVQALVAASGRELDTTEKANAFVDSLPFAVSHTFGGNSSCIELRDEGAGRVLLDMGSGARAAAGDALRELKGAPGEFHVFQSHLHWDHIMGFPFFTPAYIPGHKITIYGCHDELEFAFRRQQDAPSFPVGFALMGAKISFVQLEPGKPYDIAGYRVVAKPQLHGGDSFGYRFERGGHAIVYSTDSEHKLEDAEESQGFVDFFSNADVVIFDAMYSLADTVSVKEDWGHSSNVVGVELCQLAKAKQLVLFHHEPAFDDATIERVWRETQRLEQITRNENALTVTAAYDGLEITI